MNEFNDLERELQSLRPRAASRELRSRIEEQLAAPVKVRRWRAILAVAAGLAVAGGLTVYFDTSTTPPVRPIEPFVIHEEPAFDPTKPSLIAYQRALRESEQSFSELLDAHAAASIPKRSTEPAPEPEAPLRWRDGVPVLNSPTPNQPEHRL